MITKNTTVTDLRDIALRAVDELEAGESFLVKDLFRGFEWARLPQGARIKLGSLFLQYAESEQGRAVLEKLQKTEQHQQRYRKIAGSAAPKVD